jgi:hypothetical protein
MVDDCGSRSYSPSGKQPSLGGFLAHRGFLGIRPGVFKVEPYNARSGDGDKTQFGGLG